MDSKQLIHYINQVIALVITILLFSYLGKLKPVDVEVEPTLIEEIPLLD